MLPAAPAADHAVRGVCTISTPPQTPPFVRPPRVPSAILPTRLRLTTSPCTSRPPTYSPLPTPSQSQEGPIELLDSDDDVEDTTAVAAAGNRGGAAGPGPSSAAAAAAGGGMTTRRGTKLPGPARKPDLRGDYRQLHVMLAGLKCCYPPAGGKQSVEVLAEDLARLQPGEFLNDTCIDFYMKWVGRGGRGRRGRTGARGAEEE